MKLLDKAKAIDKSQKVKIAVTEEHIDLVKACLAGEVSIRQAGEAMGYKHPGSFTSFMNVVMRYLYQNKRLKIIKRN